MKLSNKLYNAIKYSVTILLPGTGALYFALAQIWGFPNSEGVNGTVNAVAVFLGLLIGYSTRQYNRTDAAPDGDLVVMTDEDGEKYLGLGVNGDSVEALTTKETVKLKVVESRPKTLEDLEP